MHTPFIYLISGYDGQDFACGYICTDTHFKKCAGNNAAGLVIYVIPAQYSFMVGVVPIVQDRPELRGCQQVKFVKHTRLFYQQFVGRKRTIKKIANNLIFIQYLPEIFPYFYIPFY